MFLAATRSFSNPINHLFILAQMLAKQVLACLCFLYSTPDRHTGEAGGMPLFLVRIMFLVKHLGQSPYPGYSGINRSHRGSCKVATRKVMESYRENSQGWCLVTKIVLVKVT